MMYEVSCPVVFLAGGSNTDHSGTKLGRSGEVCEMLGLLRLPSTLP